jgi:hypothetical protein
MNQLARRPIRTHAPVIRQGNTTDKLIQQATTFFAHLMKQLGWTLLGTLFKHGEIKATLQSKAVAKLLGKSSDDDEVEPQRRLYNNNYNNSNNYSNNWTQSTFPRGSY